MSEQRADHDPTVTDAEIADIVRRMDALPDFHAYEPPVDSTYIPDRLLVDDDGHKMVSSHRPEFHSYVSHAYGDIRRLLRAIAERDIALTKVRRYEAALRMVVDCPDGCGHCRAIIANVDLADDAQPPAGGEERAGEGFPA